MTAILHFVLGLVLGLVFGAGAVLVALAYQTTVGRMFVIFHGLETIGESGLFNRYLDKLYNED